MFSKEDVKQLIESVNVGSLADDEKSVLVEDVHKKLTEAFEQCKKEAIEECTKEAEARLRRERVKSFKSGADSAKEMCESTIQQTESTAFAAGREQAINEAMEAEEEVSEELIAKLEELCKEFDISCKLVELATHEDTKEYFKESTKKAVSEFVEKKINESFPQKMIVNYDRLNKLEEVFESLKQTLTVSDESVCEAREAAKEAVRRELDEAKESLVVQTKKRIAAEQLLESTKAQNYLLRKVSALPVKEQQFMLESFNGATVAQINESFDKEYQRMLRKHGRSTPVVNDVIAESTVGKNLVREAEESAKATNGRESVNESASEKPQAQEKSLMDAYTANCRYMKF